MVNSTGSRFSPKGGWRGEDGWAERMLFREVLDLARATFQCDPLPCTEHIVIPDDLVDTSAGRFPVTFSPRSRVGQVRKDEHDGFIDFIGFGTINHDHVSFMATLRAEGEGQYSLWGPIILVP